MIKMSFVGFVLGLLASVMARLVGDGSPASYAVFTAGWLVVLLLLQRREWRRRKARRCVEIMLLQPGHPNYIARPQRRGGGDGSTG